MKTETNQPAKVTRREQPVLNLPRAAVCLHYVEHLCGGDPLPAAYPHCEVMGSMELDLLAYRFQEPAPLGSRIEGNNGSKPTANRRKLMIKFPKSFDYHSEGRTLKLVTESREREVDILVSSTRFLNAGLRIWHLTLTPRDRKAFNEFDIIKLIHLYDGRTERTELKNRILFGLGDSDGTVPAAGLPQLLGLGLQKGSAPELRCGTIELLVGRADAGADAKGGNPHLTVLKTLQRAREDEGGNDGLQLKEWMDGDCLERSIIMAYCGIVTGIFDFDKIDDEEALDTLEPTYASTSAFLRIHRRTLISIAESDRAMEECRNSVGISPYLIIPHATLLGNESLVDSAELLLDKMLDSKSASLADLEAAYLEADSKLNTLYLPNIFNYVTERSLFAQGSEARGSNDKRKAVLAKLDQLKDNIGITREQEHNSGQFVVQLLLGLISLLQIKSVFVDIFNLKNENMKVWIVIFACAILFGAAVFWSLGRGKRSRIVKGRLGSAARGNLPSR
jgi:hypothetical protein